MSRITPLSRESLPELEDTFKRAERALGDRLHARVAFTGPPSGDSRACTFPDLITRPTPLATAPLPGRREATYVWCDAVALWLACFPTSDVSDAYYHGGWPNVD